MDRKTLDLYIYMGSSKPVIKWLEKEGVTTVKAAKDKLSPMVSGLVGDSLRMGGSLAGTSGVVDKVINHFEKKEKELKKA